MNISPFVQAARLAQAAYATLSAGPMAGSLQNLVNENFTLTQRIGFSADYPAVVFQYADKISSGGMGTGFNATVFKDKAGNLKLAIRGTDSLDVGGNTSDLSTGVDIVGSGAGYDQIVATVNGVRHHNPCCPFNKINGVRHQTK